MSEDATLSDEERAALLRLARSRQRSITDDEVVYGLADKNIIRLEDGQWSFTICGHLAYLRELKRHL
jgi:hypothetical protein